MTLKHVETADEKAAQLQSAAISSAPKPVAFGRLMKELFNFATTYTPLNHGSYGTFPRSVLEYRQQLERDFEARESIYKWHTYPKLLKESRALVAPFLGADVDEIVFVQNATTGANTVLRNFAYEEGDVILHFSSIYPACLKTIENLCEISPLQHHSIDVIHPCEDADLVARFESTAQELQSAGKKVKIALFDTILTKPGVLVPWEDLVAVCKELRILSLVDAAHGIGQIDMRHTASVRPDFLVTNCHKWLFVPRGSAILYVPFRNQTLIKTCLPTSHGYEPPAVREKIPTAEYFTNLFFDVATTDNAPYICLPAALAFREQTCGGEAAIRDYCIKLAKEGGDRIAELLGTEAMDNSTGTLRRCCFANIRLPLDIIPGDGKGPDGGVPEDKVQVVFDWFYDRAALEYDTYFQIKFYQGQFWVRISAQVYLEMADMEWAAKTLLELCERVKRGEWKTGAKGSGIVSFVDD